MNKKQALKWSGREFRIRRQAIRLNAGGERLPQQEEKWFVGEVSDDTAEIRNVSTGHNLQLGLDNVREFRSPDFLLLQCQLTITGQDVSLEPLIITSFDRSISGFESLLSNTWSLHHIAGREVWISDVDNMFQMAIGDNDGQFDEPWTRRFPDRFGAWGFPVTLEVQGVAIRQLRLVACDGGRIVVPIPDRKMVGDQGLFSFDRNSLEYKVAQIIGQFYIYETLDGVARHARVEVG